MFKPNSPTFRCPPTHNAGWLITRPSAAARPKTRQLLAPRFGAGSGAMLGVEVLCCNGLQCPSSRVQLREPAPSSGAGRAQPCTSRPERSGGAPEGALPPSLNPQFRRRWLGLLVPPSRPLHQVQCVALRTECCGYRCASCAPGAERSVNGDLLAQLTSTRPQKPPESAGGHTAHISEPVVAGVTTARRRPHPALQRTIRRLVDLHQQRVARGCVIRMLRVTAARTSRGVSALA